LLAETIRRDLSENIDPRRIAKLFANEPALLEAAAARLQRISPLLQRAIAEHAPEIPRVDVLVATDLAVTLWHTSWEILGQRLNAGEDAHPVANYLEHCEKLREITRA